ncbi:hypothetical protein VNI00_000495 [Paramarasmius palmivorus]|uniref:Uncharacterized protein n=1 Tax=Paramarasmius palmivorus TaxID=297713 RepID=A0AAW0EBG1_9AGAR
MTPTGIRKEFIEIHDTDSEPEYTQPSKRQKLSNSSSQRMDRKITKTSSIATLASKNGHLKGRKRFNADLEDMKEACKKGFVAHGFKATKLRAGDDEGSFELFVSTTTGEHILSVNILIPETSDYPKDHTCFAYSLEGEPSSNLQDVIEAISTSKPRSIPEMVEFTLHNLYKAMSSDDVESDELDDEEDYEAFDLDEDASTSHRIDTRVQLSRMQMDFIDTVASSYRPALTRFGGDDFCISVSLPVIDLAESIPPRALMAWDRRLLSRSLHLVLLISGFQGVYPSPDYAGGAYERAHNVVQAPLTFKVGLCGKYKPGKDYTRDAVKKHKLIVADAEDLLWEQKEKERLEARAAMYEWDGEGEDPLLQAHSESEDEEEEEDAERFDKFSLSSSLECLMDQMFLKLVNIRRRNRLGWAGAEFVLWEIEKNQMREEDVIQLKAQEIRKADKEERTLAATNNLPHDPLVGLERDQDVNVPLAAFCYLVRRLALCTRYCIVCHSKLQMDFEVLKPYVCDSKLCSYQYYHYEKGPSLEYEIVHNPRTVDLLVSLAYSAASEGVMDDPLPIGMDLRVPKPDVDKIQSAPTYPHLCRRWNVSSTATKSGSASE